MKSLTLLLLGLLLALGHADNAAVAQDATPTVPPTPTIPAPKGAPWSESEKTFLGSYLQYVDWMEAGMNDVSSQFMDSAATPGLATTQDWKDKLASAALNMRRGGEAMLTLKPSSRLRKFHTLNVLSARQAIQAGMACSEVAKQASPPSLYVCTMNMLDAYDNMEKAKLELSKLLLKAP